MRPQTTPRKPTDIVLDATIRNSSVRERAPLPDIDTANTTTFKSIGGIGTSQFSLTDQFNWELRPEFPIFSLVEPCGFQIDVEASFAPHGPLRTTFLRIVLLIWALQVLYVDVIHYHPSQFVYIHGISHPLGSHSRDMLFFRVIVVCIARVVTNYSLSARSGGPTPHRIVQSTWLLYSIVAPLQMAITFLYWVSLSTGPATYISVMEHGGLTCLVWLDGLVLGRVPVRAKHVYFLSGLCFMYTCWSIADVVLGIGGGEWGPANTDDALYPVLQWGRDSKSAALLSAFAVCVLAPGLFFLSWALSFSKRRRHCCSWDVSGRSLYGQEDESAAGDGDTAQNFGYTMA